MEQVALRISMTPPDWSVLPTEFLEQLPFPIWRTNANAECDFVNFAWLRFRGTNPEEDFGRGWLSAVHPEDVEGAQREFADAFARRSVFQREHRAQRWDGSFVTVRMASIPYYDASGFVGYVGSMIESLEAGNAERSGPSITLREGQVLKRIAAGEDNLSIAAQLSISERTVKAHVSSLYGKLKLSNRIQLALWALRNGYRPEAQPPAGS